MPHIMQCNFFGFMHVVPKHHKWHRHCFYPKIPTNRINSLLEPENITNFTQSTLWDGGHHWLFILQNSLEQHPTAITRLHPNVCHECMMQNILITKWTLLVKTHHHSYNHHIIIFIWHVYISNIQSSSSFIIITSIT